MIVKSVVRKEAVSEPWGFLRLRLQKLLLATRRVNTCLTFATDDPGGTQLFYGNPSKEAKTYEVQQILGDHRETTAAVPPPEAALF